MHGGGNDYNTKKIGKIIIWKNQPDKNLKNIKIYLQVLTIHQQQLGLLDLGSCLLLWTFSPFPLHFSLDITYHNYDFPIVFETETPLGK